MDSEKNIVIESNAKTGGTPVAAEQVFDGHVLSGVRDDNAIEMQVANQQEPSAEVVERQVEVSKKSIFSKVKGFSVLGKFINWENFKNFPVNFRTFLLNIIIEKSKCSTKLIEIMFKKKPEEIKKEKELEGAEKQEKELEVKEEEAAKQWQILQEDAFGKEILQAEVE